jgi:nicotinic acid mononucleotide adenylyltransferase
MGEDSLNGVSTWREPRRLLEMAPPVVMPRPVDLQRSGAYGRGGRRPEALLGVQIHWLEGQPIEFSSTKIREALSRGEQPEGVAPAVFEYMEEHGLYRPGESS